MTIETIFEVGDYASSKGERTSLSCLAWLMEEVGELATEVNIQAGYSYKTGGPDGVLGESIDVLVSVVDLIHLNFPALTAHELWELVGRKCAKWRWGLDACNPQ
jgi:NTP pyrophosphatase (non-canonical NTP hydrolase)